jgi:hypothetical protein
MQMIADAANKLNLDYIKIPGDCSIYDLKRFWRAGTATAQFFD